ncbi:ABC transporter ATP-binding protein [Streptomyces caniscabiei]|uniref:ABC transporter ATP-binding protein n=1 Tax=Streptomyces caniscabiei TaxID=2746961 RepID=A0ABU4N1E3_9ACTN|nr:oligopeptide/dipeptide ABC transporter ATP-binding protein [Streptomyces caniscabiei]MBE4735581.1 ABC transporter ATP-binding protein [Streptomyces caniscabiei]MBE4758194.1 ABC transporter ATP-binding protein [Streptomyces caniscabiei]MBE4789449.1 ABC transporter ATP-binding protein [Streptomyces caniscabiei]MBE4795999.1 ABC transporter ATP-binding protein [Streptomyces caniscabiei]MDX2946967.1 ABC transporter ATP-binding protein [Streptomyces caniscabiei]
MPPTDAPPGDAPPASDVLLSVRGLRVAFGGVEAVRGLSFDVRPREVLALVGESGAGKSLTARALLGMLPEGATSSGTVRLRGETDLAAQRGRRIALVPQDALSALSPVHPVGDQLAAAVRSVARVSRKEARARAVDALDRVGIPDAGRRARAYPHEYSGGMRQRAVIAMATINEPDVVVADEPTTALDAELQEQVLRVLAAQREAVGAALVLVTHDLEVVREHADRVLVMYAGRQVEQGPAATVWCRPRAPYTAGLLASLPPDDADDHGNDDDSGSGSGSGSGHRPRPAGRRRRRLPSIPGSPPAPDARPPGCAFAPRCPLVEDRCRREEPRPWAAGDGHEVSCHRWDEVPHPATELFLERV